MTFRLYFQKQTLYQKENPTIYQIMENYSELINVQLEDDHVPFEESDLYLF